MILQCNICDVSAHKDEQHLGWVTLFTYKAFDAQREFVVPYHLCSVRLRIQYLHEVEVCKHLWNMRGLRPPEDLSSVTSCCCCCCCCDDIVYLGLVFIWLGFTASSLVIDCGRVITCTKHYAFVEYPGGDSAESHYVITGTVIHQTWMLDLKLLDEDCSMKIPR